jgi:excisionase family DNA binding protein
MENGKGTSRETELLAATEVAELIGIKETTIYRWCKEGKLPCLKVGKHWRIRREALEDFLRESERPRTLVGQLSSFLREPDSVLAIAQNIDSTVWTRPSSGLVRLGEDCWPSSTPARSTQKRSCSQTSSETASKPGA